MDSAEPPLAVHGLYTGVIVNITNSMGLLAVIPLALLFFTGVYLFVLPYAAK